MTHFLRWKVLALIAMRAALVFIGKAREHARRRRGGKGTDDKTINDDVVMAASQKLGIQVRKLSGGFLELQKNDQITYSNGSEFMFENVISWKISGDKLATATLLKEHGLP